jgi:hypothetical protein
MSILQWVLETVFWVLLVLGQTPGALLLLLSGLVVRAHEVLGPALRALLLWPPAQPLASLPARAKSSVTPTPQSERPTPGVPPG